MHQILLVTREILVVEFSRSFQRLRCCRAILLKQLYALIESGLIGLNYHHRETFPRVLTRADHHSIKLFPSFQTSSARAAKIKFDLCLQVSFFVEIGSSFIWQ
jgi:hypothetical protein